MRHIVWFAAVTRRILCGHSIREYFVSEKMLRDWRAKAWLVILFVDSHLTFQELSCTWYKFSSVCCVVVILDFYLLGNFEDIWN